MKVLALALVLDLAGCGDNILSDMDSGIDAVAISVVGNWQTRVYCEAYCWPDTVYEKIAGLTIDEDSATVTFCPNEDSCFQRSVDVQIRDLCINRISIETDEAGVLSIENFCVGVNPDWAIGSMRWVNSNRIMRAVLSGQRI